MTRSGASLLALVASLASAPAAASDGLRVEFDAHIEAETQDSVRDLVELALRAASSRAQRRQTVVRVRGGERSPLVRLEVEDEASGRLLTRTVDVLALGAPGAKRLLA